MLTGRPGADRPHRTTVVGLLVTYERPDALADTLAALAAQSCPPDRLVVLDNGRPDPTARVLASLDLPFPVEHVPLGENLGPAGALARGAALLTAAGAEPGTDGDPAAWVLLLDDDDPPRRVDDLARLRDFADARRDLDPTTAAVGVVGARFDRRRGRTVRLEDGELAAASVDVDYLGGGVLPMYSAEAIRSAGLTDPDLFFGFDDLDLGLRLRDAGHRLCVPGPMLLERRIDDDRLGLPPAPPPEVPWRRYYSVRNLVLVLRRRGDRSGAALAAARALGGSVATTARGEGHGLRHLAMTARGVVDGLRGRTGRRVTPPPPPGVAAPA